MQDPWTWIICRETDGDILGCCVAYADNVSPHWILVVVRSATRTTYDGECMLINRLSVRRDIVKIRNTHPVKMNRVLMDMFNFSRAIIEKGQNSQEQALLLNLMV